MTGNLGRTFALLVFASLLSCRDSQHDAEAPDKNAWENHTILEEDEPTIEDGKRASDQGMIEWCEGYTREQKIEVARAHIHDFCGEAEFKRLINRRLPQTIAEIGRASICDPWGYWYRVEQMDGRHVRICSNGPDGKPATEDDIFLTTDNDNIKRQEILSVFTDLCARAELARIETSQMPSSLEELFGLMYAEFQQYDPKYVVPEPSVPVDSWGNQFRLERSGTSISILSSGPDGEPGTTDDLSRSTDHHEVKYSAATMHIRKLRRLCEKFREHVGCLPASLEDLVRRPDTLPQSSQWQGPYLASGVPRDPWGGEYRMKPDGPYSVEIISNGPDGKPETRDDVGN